LLTPILVILIYIAFGLRSLQLIKGGPDWAVGGTERFNIEAKAEDPTTATEAQLHQMLQALLVDRFRLKFHRESKDAQGFALVVSKNGPKLVEAKDDGETHLDGSLKPKLGEPISLSARKYSMKMLANLLSQVGRGSVLDKTGLLGAYNFTLSWDETSGPSLVTALQEQLGLRFESEKVPESLFVIDSAQRPNQN
jgi:uncharacterized protein (TIGR03435 family)